MKKNPSKKYFSPYLEPINAPEEPWYENENIKLHNLNAKKQKRRQKLRENIITNKQITQEVELVFIINFINYIIRNFSLLAQYNPQYGTTNEIQ